jgi:hypothetical protein
MNEADGVGVGVDDGLTEGEVGEIGSLEGDKAAELETIGTDDIATLVTVSDGDGVGVRVTVVHT